MGLISTLLAIASEGQQFGDRFAPCGLVPGLLPSRSCFDKETKRNFSNSQSSAHCRKVGSRRRFSFSELADLHLGRKPWAYCRFRFGVLHQSLDHGRIWDFFPS